MKTLKNYRLGNDIIKKLDELKDASDKTATDIVSAIINYASEETYSTRPTLHIS